LLGEVLLALSLLIGTVAVIGAVFPFSYTADQKAWKKSFARGVATSTLERMQTADFDTLAGGITTVTEDSVEYQVEVVVTPVTEFPSRAKRVVCTVTWPRRNGVDSLVQETILTRYAGGE